MMTTIQRSRSEYALWGAAILAMLLVLLLAATAMGGMPAVLPSDLPKRVSLTEWGHARLRAISFFGVGVLTAAGVVCALWNWLQRDFPKLPRLSYGKALGVTVLWGLLFIVVLTMISGARELMTPGAWRKSGFAYQLADPPKATPSESSSDYAAPATDSAKP